MSVSINHIDERFFIKSANCPIFGTDLNGRIIEWNSKISDLSGCTWKDAHGLNLVDSFIGEQYQEKVRQWLRQAVLDSDSCQQNLKTEFVFKEKEFFPKWVFFKIIQNNQNTKLFFFLHMFFVYILIFS